MIEVLLNKPEFEYDIHSLIKAFFPEQYVGVSAEKKEYDEKIYIRMRKLRGRYDSDHMAGDRACK